MSDGGREHLVGFYLILDELERGSAVCGRSAPTLRQKRVAIARELLLKLAFLVLPDGTRCSEAAKLGSVALSSTLRPYFTDVLEFGD